MFRRVAGRPALPGTDLAAQRRRTMSRCQRRIVSGVTSSRSPRRRAFGIALSKAASSARSAQFRCGRRGCRRCGTVSWWRRIKISAACQASSRRDSRSHVVTRVMRRKANCRHMTGDHHGRAPGEQLCWSEPWMRFSARTGRPPGQRPAGPGPKPATGGYRRAGPGTTCAGCSNRPRRPAAPAPKRTRSPWWSTRRSSRRTWTRCGYGRSWTTSSITPAAHPARRDHHPRRAQHRRLGPDQHPRYRLRLH